MMVFIVYRNNIALHLDRMFGLCPQYAVR